MYPEKAWPKGDEKKHDEFGEGFLINSYWVINSSHSREFTQSEGHKSCRNLFHQKFLPYFFRKIHPYPPILSVDNKGHLDNQPKQSLFRRSPLKLPYICIVWSPPKVGQKHPLGYSTHDWMNHRHAKSDSPSEPSNGSPALLVLRYLSMLLPPSRGPAQLLRIGPLTVCWWLPSTKVLRCFKSF